MEKNVPFIRQYFIERKYEVEINNNTYFVLVNCDIKLLRPNSNNLRLMCVYVMLRILVTVRPFSSIDLLSKIGAIRYLANEERAISTKLSIFQQEFCFSPTLMLWIQFRSAAVVTFSMLKFIFRKNGTIQTPNLAYVFLMWSIESQQIINILILYFQYFANQRKKKLNQATTTSTDISKYDPNHGCNASFVF